MRPACPSEVLEPIGVFCVGECTAELDNSSRQSQQQVAAKPVVCRRRCSIRSLTNTVRAREKEQLAAAAIITTPNKTAD